MAQPGQSNLVCLMCIPFVCHAAGSSLHIEYIGVLAAQGKQSVIAGLTNVESKVDLSTHI